MKDSLTSKWNVKIKLQKIVMNLLDKLQKLYMHEWNVHPEIFSRPQVRKF